MKIKFTKMHGAGNDFMLVDDRGVNFPEHDVERIRRLAVRGTGVGCEGIILVRLAETFSECDYRMVFLNPDGSRVSMCGNAVRCLALFAFENGIGGRLQRIGTDAGVIVAEVLELCPGGSVVRVHLTEPTAVSPDVRVRLPDGREVRCFKVDTGVPHAVVFVEDVAQVDVRADGRAIRFDEAFAPAGTNVDFVQVVEGGASRIRTYERGVEAESGACGTGAVAAGVAMAEKLGLPLPVSLSVSSGAMLVVDGQVDASGHCHTMMLTGPARKVYEASLEMAWTDAP